MKDINFHKPKVVVCVGKPRMGKSNMVKYLLLKNMLNKKIFKFGIVFTRTKFNDDYDYIPEKYIYTEYKPEILKKYMNGLEKLKKKTGSIPPNFVVMDDQQGLLNRQDSILTNFVSSHRHFSCSFFANFQYLFGASPLLRECTTNAIMFRSVGLRTINGLFENFGMLWDNVQEFKEYFHKNTQKKYTAIMYEQKINEKDDNYKRIKAPNMKIFKNIKLQY